ncbi:hypothetical protein GCM10023329_02840 [Streptomyces sanyensis]|uniref:Uncharacterized protein n=1 Tax=Streptomyces sanyensis TaxID=568869 RepID=A0ABP8ZNP2_9ACTN
MRVMESSERYGSGARDRLGQAVSPPLGDVAADAVRGRVPGAPGGRPGTRRGTRVAAPAVGRAAPILLERGVAARAYRSHILQMTDYQLLWPKAFLTLRRHPVQADPDDLGEPGPP